MLTPKQISDLYSRFGDNFPYRDFAVAANAYYLMVTRRISLTRAVRQVTGSAIGFRVSEAINAGKYLFRKVGTRYVPLGYLATVTANIHGGGTLTFSLWFPFYYTDYYKVLRDVAHFITSSAGAFSYTLRVSPFINHGRFRIQQGLIIYEGTFRYQWGDDLCYFEIEIEKNCRTGRIIKRHSVMVHSCSFIPPLVPEKIEICLVVPTPTYFIREPWMLPDNVIYSTYRELQDTLSVQNYQLFRAAILAYQLMVERDYSLSTAAKYMSRLTGISASVITTFMIDSKLVGKPSRHENRAYDPYGYEVSYSLYTKESPGKNKGKKEGLQTSMELRFTIWQPYYAPIPFTNVYQVSSTLLASLGSPIGESVLAGIIRAFGGESLEDLEDILEQPLEYQLIKSRKLLRNRDKYTIILINTRRHEAFRYDGIMRYQWEKDIICYLYIETLRRCAKFREESGWHSHPGPVAIITDRGFAFCDWVFDDHLRLSTADLNFNNLC